MSFEPSAYPLSLLRTVGDKPLREALVVDVDGLCSGVTHALGICGKVLMFKTKGLEPLALMFADIKREVFEFKAAVVCCWWLSSAS